MLDLGVGVKLVTRAEWGARDPKARTPARLTDGCTLHWEGPHMGWPWDHAACAGKVRTIQNFHMDSRGWNDIAYNALYCGHGFVFEGRWINQRSGANGTNLGNDTSYAICFIGGEGDTFTAEAHLAALVCCAYLRRNGGAGLHVRPHSYWFSTACPGDVIRSDIAHGDFDSNPTQPDPIEELFMALTQVEQEEMRDKIRALHDLFTKGAPGYGIPPLAQAITFTQYSLDGVELDGHPSSIRKHITYMRDSSSKLWRRMFGVLGVSDNGSTATYDPSKDQSRV